MLASASLVQEAHLLLLLVLGVLGCRSCNAAAIDLGISRSEGRTAMMRQVYSLGAKMLRTERESFVNRSFVALSRIVQMTVPQVHL